MELPMGLGHSLSKDKMAALYREKFKAYKNLSALVALACALFGLSLWVWDYAVDPVNASNTIYLRVLLMLCIAPLSIYIFSDRWHEIHIPFFLFVIVVSESIFVLILNHLDNGHAYGSGAFIYWFLFIPIMGAVFPLRTNLIALSTIPFPPLIMYHFGYAPNLPVLLHMVYSASSFIVVAVIVFLSNRLILRLLITQDHLTKARDKAVELAHTDPLTGINNRRAFFINAEKSLAHARRYKQPTAVVMLDIDHFKKVNDSFGHAVGDDVIKSITDLCQNTFREVDIIGRMGGEEFAFVLVGASIEDAMLVTERLRINIEESKVMADGKIISVTASFGVTQYRGDIQTIDTLLAEADVALYKAKSTGRNKVVVFTSGQDN